MKIIKVEQSNTYSCQFCRKEFRTNRNLKIITNHSPICSNLCRYRFIYQIVSSYSDKWLLYFGKHFNLSKKILDNRAELIFCLSKIFHKLMLSSINKEAQGSGSKNNARKVEHKAPKEMEAQAQKTLYNRVLSLPFEPAPVFSYLGGRFI